MTNHNFDTVPHTAVQCYMLTKLVNGTHAAPSQSFGTVNSSPKATARAGTAVKTGHHGDQ
eukprot:971987-Lingulodinium_polyedra.AAC.1